MMKKLTAMLLTLVLAATVSGCGGTGPAADVNNPEVKNKTTSGDTEWKFEKNIAEAITATSGASEDISLGDISTNSVEITVPKGSFDAETKLMLSNPDVIPNYNKDDAEPFGSPVKITAGEGATRLNEKAVINFKFDPTTLPAGTTKSQIAVSYFDGEKWEYIRPIGVDMEKGLITFETYHFSLFGTTKIKDETTLTEMWIHSKTLDKTLRDKINKVTDHVAEQVIDLTLKKMGINDESVKGKVLADFLKEDGYKEIYDTYNKPGEEFDMTELTQKIAVLSGKKIAEIVDESAWQEGLKNLTDDGVEDVEAVAKAAGYAAEGQYKEAAKIIGEQIADKFLITTAGKIAVEVMDYQIESWKNNEVEAAYFAFKRGANGYFYGYNNDPGDFDTVWNQMRGIRRQLEIEAIKKQNEAREEAGMPPLTEAQEDSVRKSVMESYRKQFAARSEKEEEMKKAEEDLKALVEGFRSANFFDSTLGPIGLDKGFDYEGKLDVLDHFVQKIMKDTKRFELSTKSGLIMEDKISIDDIVQGARYYFSGPEGKKAYNKFLKDRFGISMYPELSKLGGSWTGSMTVTDVIISDEFRKQATEEGCDLTEAENSKGQTKPFGMSITPSGEAGGTMSVSFEGDASDPIPFTYSEGDLSASLSQEGAAISINFVMSDEGETYSGAGSLSLNYFNGGIIMKATASASKPAPQETANNAASTKTSN